MPIELWEVSEFFFIHYCGRGSHFPDGHLEVVQECTKMISPGAQFHISRHNLLSHCDRVERYFATINGGKWWQNKRNFDQNFVHCRCIF